MQSSSRPPMSLPGLSAGLVLLSGLSLSWVLSACGGGGGGAGGEVAFSVTPTLSGVAAVGAPLANAQIKVMDANGALLGSTTTQASDGSFSLILSKTVKAPLLLQATGVDSLGVPQVLHSMVPSLDANQTAVVANITPLSQAIVALSVGTDPQALFASAAASAPQIAAAATAASAAGAFLKSLIATQLTDLKVSNSAGLDLLGDPAFTANKSAQDQLLESLRVQVARSNKGVDQLLVSNKLLTTGAPEVVVGLALAQTELQKSGGVPLNAVSSTLKLASGAKATTDNFGSLDELSAGLNTLIAQGKSAADFGAASWLSAYETHNTATKTDLATRLAAFASNKRQLGRLMVTGCADDVLTAGLCKRVMVAATVSDSSGVVQEYFSDAATYVKAVAPATTGSWSLIGNARKLDIKAFPVSVQDLLADGALSTTTTPNPWVGVQIELQAQSVAATPVQLLATANVQMLSGYSIPFAYCGRSLLCISASPGASSVGATGSVTDTALQRSALGWLGSAESQRGAKFLVSYTPTGGSAETRSVYLPADVPAETGRTRYPVIDGVSSSQPLKAASLRQAQNLTYSTWAAANLDMRLISMRVLLPGATEPVLADLRPLLPGTTTLSLSALSLPSPLTQPVEMWLGAQDTQGRRYYTKYSLQAE